MNNEDLDALVTRLKELEGPQKEAVPSLADTDWRTLSGVVAREIESLRQQLDEAVSAVQRLSEGQPFDAVVVADTVKRRTEQIEQQLADHIKREVMLRDALETLWSGTNSSEWDGVAIKMFEEALEDPEQK